jgi:excisionase family DNA binding protein
VIAGVAAVDEAGPRELLKTSEAAALLGVTRSTVLSYAYRGLLEHLVTPGGQHRFYRDQIEAILSAGEHREDVGPTRQPDGGEG